MESELKGTSIEKSTQSEKKRLTIEIDAKLHGKIKSKCALKDKKMVEVITKILEDHNWDNI